MNSYYPIGTIVKLTIDADALFMIAGYLVKHSSGKTYDYFAVPYPFGLLKENQCVSFNNDSISDVLYVGYCDEECEKVLSGFEQFTENLREKIDGTENAD